MNRIAPAWLAAGVATCGMAWIAPHLLPDMPEFVAHMTRHMTLVAVAAPCLVVGAWGLFARLPAAPLLASFAEFVLVWGWHVPGAHDLVHDAGTWLIVEQACFLAIGLFFWASVLDPGRALAGAGALLLTSMHMTLLGALITLSPRPLYLCAASDPLGLDAQQLGGMIMLTIGPSVYLLAGLWRVKAALGPVSTADGSHGTLP